MLIWTWRLASSTAVLTWMAPRPLETPAIAWLGVLRSYAARIVLYGVLAALTQFSLWRWRLDYGLRWALVAAVFAALYGISDEYHQSLVFGRSGTIEDVVVNTFGATTAAGASWLMAAWWRGNQKNQAMSG